MSPEYGVTYVSERTADLAKGKFVYTSRPGATGVSSTVDVAQLVEPRVVIPAVVGSSPIVHPIREIPGR
jgi:hypothetical protein